MYVVYGLAGGCRCVVMKTDGDGADSQAGTGGRRKKEGHERSG